MEENLLISWEPHIRIGYKFHRPEWSSFNFSKHFQNERPKILASWFVKVTILYGKTFIHMLNVFSNHKLSGKTVQHNRADHSKQPDREGPVQQRLCVSILLALQCETIQSWYCIASDAGYSFQQKCHCGGCTFLRSYWKRGKRRTKQFWVAFFFIIPFFRHHTRMFQ